MKMSQDTRRVVDWLRANPGATRFEMQQALGGVHVTARMSDARAAGVEFEKVRAGKAWRFSVVEKPEQLTLSYTQEPGSVRLEGLTAHLYDVTENDDGTVTVSPKEQLTMPL